MTEPTPARPRVPTGLRAGGRRLWLDVIQRYSPLEETQLAQLTEACRQKDRLDGMDRLLRGDPALWMELVEPRGRDAAPLFVQVDSVLTKANDTANTMKQLIAAMRLPDEQTGKRPQQRPGPGGAKTPNRPGGADASNVSSLDRARASKSS